MDRDSNNLLRPGESQAGNGGLDERTAVDLDLHTTINALCEHHDQRDTVEQILRALCQDGDTIRAARISPAEVIFTHFPAEEHPELDTGGWGRRPNACPVLPQDTATPKKLTPGTE